MRRSPNKALDEVVARVGGQTPLAAICDVPLSVVSESVRQGRVTPKMGIRMATFLGVSLLDLMPEMFPDVQRPAAQEVAPAE